MPCMGPDLQYARQCGRKAGEKLLAELIKKHNMWDITAEKWAHPQICKLPGAESRWEKAKKEFVRAVEKLFVEDACNGF